MVNDKRLNPGVKSKKVKSKSYPEGGVHPTPTKRLILDSLCMY